MPRKRNPYDEVVQEIREELGRRKNEAEKSHPVPFGQERLSARDARHRYSQMSRGEIEKLTPDQRRGMVKLLGMDSVLAQLRKGGG